ncbi:hypothetical protein GCM10023169_01710 [Georgenia halophila]|uniref:DUF2530 domain-containing protein n=1 Tax=Georgenia halophila TaxID=620889 RepID=A0ABP8KSK8_9MICO
MPEVHLFEKRPDPPPAKVNAVTLTVTGTVVWIVATLAVGILELLDRVPAKWLDVCFAGLALGIVAVGWGYVHEYRLRRRARR